MARIQLSSAPGPGKYFVCQMSSEVKQGLPGHEVNSISPSTARGVFWAVASRSLCPFGKERQCTVSWRFAVAASQALGEILPLQKSIVTFRHLTLALVSIRLPE